MLINLSFEPTEIRLVRFYTLSLSKDSVCWKSYCALGAKSFGWDTFTFYGSFFAIELLLFKFCFGVDVSHSPDLYMFCVDFGLVEFGLSEHFGIARVEAHHNF
jgi:hypothetical protein